MTNVIQFYDSGSDTFSMNNLQLTVDSFSSSYP